MVDLLVKLSRFLREFLPIARRFEDSLSDFTDFRCYVVIILHFRLSGKVAVHGDIGNPLGFYGAAIKAVAARFGPDAGRYGG
jgi:hypothetical protein